MIYILMGTSCILAAILITMRYACDTWWDTIKSALTMAGVLGLLIAGGFLINAGLGG